MQKSYGLNFGLLFVVLVTTACLIPAGCAKQAVKTSETAPVEGSPAPETKKPAGGTSEPAVESGILKEHVIAAEETAGYDKKSGIPEPKGKTAGPRSYPSASGLKAGVADDNRQFNYFLNFLNQYRYVAHFPIDVSERIVFKIKDTEGRPVPNARVAVYGDGSQLSGGKTYADGSFFYFPSLKSEQHQTFNANITYGQDQVSLAFQRNGPRRIDVGLHTARTRYQQVPLDIVFILDTTGSMGEEIERLKKTIEIINLNVAAFSPRPKVRFGMVQYRDVTDQYTTRVVPLTTDLEEFSRALQKVYAGGGGDNPEDLQSALFAALHKLDWNDEGIRIGFIITDAPPHLDYGQTYTYVDAAADAKQTAIKLFSIGTGGLNVAGEYVLRQISQYTYAKYIFLTYGEQGESEGGRVGSVSHHTGANYQTDKLEAIIIRIAKEELSHLADRPIEQGEDYFQARKMDDERREETLQKLFDQAVSQLVDYSTVSIIAGTPAAVIPIAVSDESDRPDAEYFTEQLLFSFSRNKTFKAVERQDLQTILKELQINLSGLVDEKNAASAGKMLGADMIIAGKLVEKKNDFTVFLKLLRVETAEILAITKLRIDKRLGISG
jgi:Mg-chelatase subunit ChlD